MPTSLIEWVAFILVSSLTLFFIIKSIQLEIEHRRTIKVIKLLNDIGKEVRFLTFFWQQHHDINFKE
jgi:hypothetical protein